MTGARQHLFTAITLPQEPGCYIVRSGERVVYVGKSKCLHYRWFTRDSKHHRYDFIKEYFPDATIECVLCPEDDLSVKEMELIRKLNPIMNHTTIDCAVKKWNLVKAKA